MAHHFYFYSMLILVLLNICCYSSPIAYADHHNQEAALSASDADDQEMIKPSTGNQNTKWDYLKILCALYDDCSNKEHEDFVYTEIKPKRLTSNLFHGIPKFGKRAFTSAFSGIPKFG